MAPDSPPALTPDSIPGSTQNLDNVTMAAAMEALSIAMEAGVPIGGLGGRGFSNPTYGIPQGLAARIGMNEASQLSMDYAGLGQSQLSGEADLSFEANGPSLVSGTPQDPLALNIGMPDTYLAAASKVAPYGSFYDVRGHGSWTQIGVGDQATAIGAKEAAWNIFFSSDYWPGQPVRFLSCHVGAQDDGFAAQVAKELLFLSGRNMVVVAPNTTIGIDTFQEPFLGTPFPEYNLGPGRWRAFDSNGPIWDSLGPKLPPE